MDAYTVFDVETPNQFNDTICQIGVVHFNNGKITEVGSLVDPECEFGQINTRIHGINSTQVKGEPIFPVIWERISPYFEDKVIIGHNVKGADLTILTKTLYKYGIYLKPLKYIDTIELFKFLNAGQRCRLSDCCEQFGIKQAHHHDALDDARVTYELFLKLTNQLSSVAGFIKTFYPEDVNLKNVRKADQYSKLSSERRVLREEFKVMLLKHELYCKYDDPVCFAEKVICISGEFKDKDKLTREINQLGGMVTNKLNHTVDFLFVGNASPKWKEKTYGTKVAKAIEMAKQGHQIKVILHEDFLDQA